MKINFNRVYEKIDDAFENVFKFENFIFLGFVSIIFVDNYLDFIKSVISIATLQFSLIVLGLYRSHYRQGKIEANLKNQERRLSKLERLFERMLEKQENSSKMLLELTIEIERKFNTIEQKITNIEEEFFKK